MPRYSEASAPVTGRRQILRGYGRDDIWRRASTLVAFLTLLLAAVFPVRAAEVISPAPAHYFNDYTHTIPAAAGDAIDAKLQQFEKDTSNQILVVMYPTMQSDSSIEDYTVRVAQKWGVGQKDRRNGVVLFIFKNDHRMRIEVGYGLEGALPDITAGQILDSEIKPRFRADDYAGGINAGVDAIIAATKGEYKGKPVQSDDDSVGSIIPIIIFIVVVILIFKFGRNGGIGWGPFIYTGGGWGRGGGGGWSSGGGSWGGGGGGGFSGGGGSFGGGGASGSW